jgi:hypothetical protein
MAQLFGSLLYVSAGKFAGMSAHVIVVSGGRSVKAGGGVGSIVMV